jgi:hypothetical protein
MKLFRILAWIFGILAVLIMVLGTIPLITGNNLFSVRHEVNYFIVANSLLLLSILCLLARQGCIQKKE